MQDHLTEPAAELHVAALCDVELASVLRRSLLTGRLSEQRAFEAVEDYFDLPLTRHGHAALVAPILTLRHNFSAYDACYVALAHSLGAKLLTTDFALARAVSAHVDLALRWD